MSPAWLAEAYYRLAESATPLQAGEYRFPRPSALSDGHRPNGARRRRAPRDRRPGGPDRRGDLRALSRPRHLAAAGLSQRLHEPAAARVDRARRAGPRRLSLPRHLRRHALDLGPADRRVDGRQLPPPLHAGDARARGCPRPDPAPGRDPRLDRPEGNLARPGGAPDRRALPEPAAARDAAPGRPDGRLRARSATGNGPGRCTDPTTVSPPTTTPTVRRACPRARSATRAPTRSRPPSGRPTRTTSTSWRIGRVATRFRGPSRSTCRRSPRPAAGNASRRRPKEPNRRAIVPCPRRPGASVLDRPRRGAHNRSNPNRCPRTRCPAPSGPMS